MSKQLVFTRKRSPNKKLKKFIEKYQLTCSYNSRSKEIFENEIMLTSVTNKTYHVLLYDDEDSKLEIDIKIFFMVKNMNNLKQQTRNHLEKVFSKINIEYEQINLDDDDINYIVSFTPRKLKDSLGSIEFLAFYSGENSELVVICPNIYKIREQDSTLSILNALNNANQRLSSGSVTLNDNVVIYRCIKRFKDIEDIKEQDIKDILDNVLIAIIYTHEEIKEIKKGEE